MSKEAMKLALEALKELVAQTETGLFAVRHDHVAMQDARQAITALREALSKPDFWEGYVPEPVKPAQQEPVGSVHVDTLAMLPSIKSIDGGAKIYPVSKAKYDAAYRLIYTSPQRTWVDLTDKEILASPENLIACIAYVRNKLKEKNT